VRARSQALTRRARLEREWETHVPILWKFDVEATKRFYLDYLGCQLDWQEGEGDRLAFMQVSRGPPV
jgi:Glyoxalase superfamily protein